MKCILGAFLCSILTTTPLEKKLSDFVGYKIDSVQTENVGTEARHFVSYKKYNGENCVAMVSQKGNKFYWNTMPMCHKVEE